MNKQELVKEIAAEMKMTQKDTAAILEAALSRIEEAVAAGEKVQLAGFGTFERKQREERIARNPKTGEPVKISAGFVPVFKAGKAFRETVEK